MLYEPAQFEPLTDEPWDPAHIESAIAAIVAGYPQDSAEEVEFARHFWIADDDETAVPLNV